MPNMKPELVRGTLEMLILQTLRGARHGYGISQAIRAGSNEVLRTETGSLYPALQRLEKQGFVRTEWRTTDNKQRTRYYTLTPAGRKHLSSEQARWKTLADAISAIMNPQRGES